MTPNGEAPANATRRDPFVITARRGHCRRDRRNVVITMTKNPITSAATRTAPRNSSTKRAHRGRDRVDHISPPSIARIALSVDVSIDCASQLRR